MFGERETRPVVLRGAGSRRLDRRVLWWVGLRVVVAREVSWSGAPYRDFLWLPGPDDLPDSTMVGVVCRCYAPAALVLVAAGCAGGWLLGGALAALVAVLVTVVLVAGNRYVRARRRRLPGGAGPDDQRLLAEAGRRAERVLRDWPALGELGTGLRPRPVLEDALWELAGVLAARCRVRAARDRLAAFGGTGCDGELPARAATLVATADRRLAELDREVRARAASIARLDDRCHHLAAHRRATARLDELAGQLRDALTDPAAGGAPDPAEPLAGHVDAVLDAYQELSAGSDPTVAAHPTP